TRFEPKIRSTVASASKKTSQSGSNGMPLSRTLIARLERCSDGAGRAEGVSRSVKEARPHVSPGGGDFSFDLRELIGPGTEIADRDPHDPFAAPKRRTDDDAAASPDFSDRRQSGLIALA